MHRSVSRLLLCLALWGLGLAGSARAQYVNFEAQQTRPICLSPDGTRLFAPITPGEIFASVTFPITLLNRPNGEKTNISVVFVDNSLPTGAPTGSNFLRSWT